jgi:hypothetical protein
MGVRILKPAAVALALALPLAAQFVEENRTVTKRFTVSGAPEIVVSVITGDIKVTAHSGSEVVMNAKIHYEAPDGGALGDLQKRIRFEAEQRGNNVWIGTETDNWYNGSSSYRSREFGWRNQTPSPSSPGEGGRRWKFRHDIELQVPRTAHLKLSTVNGSMIEVTGVTGEFSLNNVNGGIDIKNADGFGRAHTVNGPVSISFQRNPGGPTSIKTVNGKINLYMPAGLNASFNIKTLNGKIFSDFPMTAGASAPVSSSEDGMKRIWRSNRFSSLKIGSGGPEISIDGLNGDIQILQKKN